VVEDILQEWKFLRRCRRFWSTDHSLTALLIILAVVLFVVTPLVSTAAISSEIGIAFFSLLTVIGVATVGRRAGVVALVATCAVASITFDWLAHFRGSEHIQVIDIGLRAGFILLLASLVTAQVFRPGDVTHHRVQGAIVVFLLAGLAWGYVYEIVAIVNPLAFDVPMHVGQAFARPGLFRYFSFETLTTLGYGDVLPRTPIARSFVSCEAVFGQLYPAAMIARLVSLEFSERRGIRFDRPLNKRDEGLRIDDRGNTPRRDAPVP
jgi:hypothetical protein